MLTLYHAPSSRSSRFLWLLEEIGQPYAVKLVSIRRRDGSGRQDPGYTQISAQIPAEYVVHPRIVVSRKTGEEMIRRAESVAPTAALRKLMRDGD